MKAKDARSPDEVFIQDYSREYQEFLKGFQAFQRLYQQAGPRRVDESRLPLRIELDQFISFIRERHISGVEWTEQPLLDEHGLRTRVSHYFNEWTATDWQYLYVDAPASYALFRDVMSDPSALADSSEEQLFQMLLGCHSFRARQRYFPGGLETLRRAFFDGNDLGVIRTTLSYLVHGRAPYVERMARCIYDPKYKLRQFGRSAVQEVFGWWNTEDIPICNQRTVKTLRFLGFDVEVFDS